MLKPTLFAALCLPLLGPALSAQEVLETTFLPATTGAAAYFDLDVTATAVTVTELGVDLASAGTVSVYRRAGTRTGQQLSAAGWTLVGTANAGVGAPTTVSLPPFTLSQGLNGLCITASTPLGVSTTAATPPVVANADLRLLAGETSTALFGGTLQSSRVPHVRLGYLRGDLCEVPPHNTNYTGYSRGFWFTAATDFCLRQLALPPQNKLPGNTAGYLVRVNGAVAYRSIGNAGAVTPNLIVHSGDVVDVIGNWSGANPGSFTARNSFTLGMTDYATDILGVSHTIRRCGWQWDIGDPNWTTSTGTYITTTFGEIGRVLMTCEPLTPAATSTLGSGCGSRFESCYQQFTLGGFDLSNSALTFRQSGNGGLSIDRSGSLLAVGATSPPVILPLGDDDVLLVPFTVGGFPGWSSLVVCSNGWVAGASGNSPSSTPTISSLLNAPETGFWSWHDFDPTTGTGRVKIEQSPWVTVVTWDNVRTYNSPLTSTLQFQLYADSTVTIAWGNVAVLTNQTHLVGFSPGGASLDPGPTDFSAIGAGAIAVQWPESGPLALASTSSPVVGTPWTLQLTNVPIATLLGVDIVGLSDPGVNDLAAIGMPGCGLRAAMDVLVPWPASGATHTVQIGVPPLALLNVDLYVTTAVLQTLPVNAFGAITSNGVRATIGTN